MQAIRSAAGDLFRLRSDFGRHKTAAVSLVVINAFIALLGLALFVMVASAYHRSESSANGDSVMDLIS
eukprot:COSAG05_NODE_16264_length_350_cov_0.613546_1_plen_67_part_10